MQVRMIPRERSRDWEAAFLSGGCGVLMLLCHHLYRWVVDRFESAILWVWECAQHSLGPWLGFFTLRASFEAKILDSRRRSEPGHVGENSGPQLHPKVVREEVEWDSMPAVVSPWR
jgi:hypothetical protein